MGRMNDVHISSIKNLYQNQSIVELNLNKVSDEVNGKAKLAMSAVFETKRLRPSDTAFLYDKRADFDPPEEIRRIEKTISKNIYYFVIRLLVLCICVMRSRTRLEWPASLPYQIGYPR